MDNTIKTRFTNGVYDAIRERIYLVDDRGILYCFDESLNLIKQSTSHLNGVTLHGITHDDEHVYTRDVAGNIICWSKTDLSSKYFLVSEHFVSPEHANGDAVPCPSHAIAASDKQLAFCNAVGGLSFVNKEDFSFIKSLDVSEKAFLEHLSVSPCGKKLFINDVLGTLYTYDFSTEQLTKLAHLNSGVSHGVVFDTLHRRFIITSDVGGGVYLLSEQGDVIDSLRFTNDDVEEIVLSDDQSHFYVCCFDHHIYIFENSEQPQLVGRIGQFKFQVNHLKSLKHNRMLAMLESGEAYIVCANSHQIVAREGGTSAYWELSLQGNHLIGTSESGVLDVYKINSRLRDFSLNKLRHIRPKISPQRLRISVVCDDGDFISVGADGVVVKFDDSGEVAWEFRAAGISRDLSIAPCKSKVAVCSEIGEISILNLANGELIHQINHHRPVWCIAYCHDGTLVFGERELRETEHKRTPSKLRFLDADYKERGCIESYGNYKRIRVLDDEHLLVSSNTNERVFLASIQNCTVKQSFIDWQINTPENAVIHDNKLYVITYGFQLITYDLASDETVDVQYILEGYPKGLCIYINEAKVPFLVLSCRNAIMSFCLASGEPELVSNRYLNDSHYHDHSTNVSFKSIDTNTYILTTKNISEYAHL